MGPVWVSTWTGKAWPRQIFMSSQSSTIESRWSEKMMQRNLTLNTVSILLIAAITSCAQVGAAPNQVAEGDKPFLLTYPTWKIPTGR